MNINRFQSHELAVGHVVVSFLKLAQEAITNRGRFLVAVAGGSTLISFFKMLSKSQDQFNMWGRIDFCWVDERWVPWNSPESNYGCALNAGLNSLPVNCHPFDTSLPSPQNAIQVYEEKIKLLLGNQPSFDLTLLGAGEDGHVASVFQSDIEVSLTGLVLTTIHPQTGQPRVSLSLRCLSESRQVFLLLFGESKRIVLHRLLTSHETVTPAEVLKRMKPDLDLITDLND